MFAFICGEVCGTSGGAIILKNNDIGYQIFVSDMTLIDYGVVGKKIQLFTYFHVTENGVSLFGFKTEAEKELFLKLLSVSGVGAKLAMTVLGGLKTERLLSAIVCGDVATLTSVKGVGKKTAERIVLELKEKISAVDVVLSGEVGFTPSLNREARDAVEALAVLGIPRPAAEKLVKDVTEEGQTNAEEIIKAALKRI